METHFFFIRTLSVMYYVLHSKVSIYKISVEPTIICFISAIIFCGASSFFFWITAFMAISSAVSL